MAIELTKYGKMFIDRGVTGLPVTMWTRAIKQPRGKAYLPVESMHKLVLDGDSFIISDRGENIPLSALGIVIDYMSRYILSGNKEDAFYIPLEGAKYVETMACKCGDDFTVKYVKDAINCIVGIDDNSICNAIYVCAFDESYRRGSYIPYKSIEDVIHRWNSMGEISIRSINKTVYDHIRIMIERSIKFFELYGPIVCEGFNFKPNGYTERVPVGDGDFLTKDTLWDFKVSKHNINSRYTLQILMYYIMGKHSGNPIFNDIVRIGIFNPRTNEVYVKPVDEISSDVIDEVSREIIGYD